MRHTDLIPLATSNGSVAGNNFVAEFVNSCRRAEREEYAWVSKLRAEGIKAAHPDDGWVNREKNTVNFCYCQFNDGVSEGDKIVLGWPEKFRTVTVTKIEKTFFGDSRYHFKGQPQPAEAMQ